MYMIWQVIVENGQQRPIEIPALLVLTGVADTTTATAARAIATATALRLAETTAFPSGHFYICRTEC